jgi:hypothetical protein
MAATLFTNAKTLEKPAVATKADKETIALPGLEEYAKLDALGKAITSVQKTLGATLKDETLSDVFYGKIRKSGELPESLIGKDGIATASLECRKRGTNQPLSDEEVKVLLASGVPVKDEVITQELFGINPVYTGDIKLLEKISKLLDGKVPADLFVKQERVVKKVVTEDTLKVACELKEKLPRNVFSLITVLAIKPTLAETNIGSIIDDVKELVVDESAAIKAEPKAKPAAKKAKKGE